MIIAVANHKCGSGKTTSTLNIAAALKRRGMNVLIVDMDPQATLTQNLKLTDYGPNIYDAIKEEKELVPIQVLPGLDVVISTLDFAGAEVEYSQKWDKYLLFREVLQPHRTKYDFILLDCPPSLGMITLNAFYACHRVYIPLHADSMAIKRIGKLIEVLNSTRISGNELPVIGVFITHYYEGNDEHRGILEAVKKHFKKKTFNTVIRNDEALVKARALEMDIFRYDPNSRGAVDYEALTIEILGRNRLYNLYM